MEELTNLYVGEGRGSDFTRAEISPQQALRSCLLEHKYIHTCKRNYPSLYAVMSSDAKLAAIQQFNNVHMLQLNTYWKD